MGVEADVLAYLTGELRKATGYASATTAWTATKGPLAGEPDVATRAPWVPEGKLTLRVHLSEIEVRGDLYYLGDDAADVADYECTLQVSATGREGDIAALDEIRAKTVALLADQLASGYPDSIGDDAAPVFATSTVELLDSGTHSSTQQWRCVLQADVIN